MNRLLETGFSGESIFVLHPKNKDTVEFAKKKQTQVHRPGLVKVLPRIFHWTGTIGIMDPVGSRQGILHWLLDPLYPREGALHEALAEMGVPDAWCNKRVVSGKLLISVKCNSWDEVFRATGVLKFTNSMDISSSVSLEECNHEEAEEATRAPRLGG